MRFLKHYMAEKSLRYDDTGNGYFVANFVLSLAVKEFLKSNRVSSFLTHSVYTVAQSCRSEQACSDYDYKYRSRLSWQSSLFI